MLAFAIVGSVEDIFGRRVRAEREDRKWTQSDLAKKLAERGIDLHPSAIAKIEAREDKDGNPLPKPRTIRLDEAQALADIFGLSVGDMTDTLDHRTRWVGNRMRIWFEKYLKSMAYGRWNAEYARDLVAQADVEDQERLRFLLMPDEMTTFFEETERRAGQLLAKLRHPQRAPEIDWPSRGAEASATVEAIENVAPET